MQLKVDMGEIIRARERYQVSIRGGGKTDLRVNRGDGDAG